MIRNNKLTKWAFIATLSFGLHTQARGARLDQEMLQNLQWYEVVPSDFLQDFSTDIPQIIWDTHVQNGQGIQRIFLQFLYDLADAKKKGLPLNKVCGKYNAFLSPMAPVNLGYGYNHHGLNHNSNFFLMDYTNKPFQDGFTKWDDIINSNELRNSTYALSDFVFNTCVQKGPGLQRGFLEMLYAFHHVMYWYCPKQTINYLWMPFTTVMSILLRFT